MPFNTYKTSNIKLNVNQKDLIDHPYFEKLLEKSILTLKYYYKNLDLVNDLCNTNKSILKTIFIIDIDQNIESHHQACEIHNDDY